MNRKQPPLEQASQQSQDVVGFLADWRGQLQSRRRFLVTLAGGAVSALFPLTALSQESLPQSTVWAIIDAVQQHLFPDEPQAPGARRINALGYLQFVVTDTSLAADEREFILKGAGWLEDMSQQTGKAAFVDLEPAARERVLQEIAASQAGQNWLSTLLMYIFEALLSDPIYGGNTDQAGWRWLQHVPGFPRPPRDKTFDKLLS